MPQEAGKWCTTGWDLGTMLHPTLRYKSLAIYALNNFNKVDDHRLQCSRLEPDHVTSGNGTEEPKPQKAEHQNGHWKVFTTNNNFILFWATGNVALLEKKLLGMEHFPEWNVGHGINHVSTFFSSDSEKKWFDLPKTSFIISVDDDRL